MPTTTIYNMDVLQGLAKLPSDSIDCIVTSPPYYGLRDYGIEGQIGNEPSYRDYLSKLLEVTAQLKRVLKPTGTLWFNIGDTYAGSGNGFGGEGDPKLPEGRTGELEPRKSDIPTKSKMQIPERLSIRMVDEQGWILRNDIIWNKPNHMPESVEDRLTKSYEHVYLFVKEKKYYFNLDSIRQEPLTKENRPYGIVRQLGYQGKYGKLVDNPEALGEPRARNSRLSKAQSIAAISQSHPTGTFSDTGMISQVGFNPIGKNPGDVWNINTEPYEEAHFACYPQELVEGCLSAGCPNNGLVLDPFAGSGTTLKVAKELGLNGIGIEINPKYVEIIKKRLHAKELLNREEFRVMNNS